jgi:hypothetical protein
VIDLKDVMVVINKWSVELTYSQSDKMSFTSYNGVEMRMVIHEMEIKKDYKVQLTKYPTNLYRDDKIKNSIQRYMIESQASTVSVKQNISDSFKSVVLGVSQGDNLHKIKFDRELPF